MVIAQFFRQGLCLMFLLLLLIRGHQGFFIKHSSGLCLQSESTYFNKGLQTGPISRQYGPLYFTLFQNTCLHPDAQFRFYEKFKVLYNIGKDGTFLTRPPSDKNSHYGGKYQIYHSPQSPSSTLFIYTSRFIMKQTPSGSLKLINSGPYCATSGKSIIPVKGSYVIQTTNCADETEQKFTFGSVTNESKSMIDVNCSPPQVMKVVKAEYGGFNNGIFDYNKDGSCSLPSTCIVKSQCDGQSSCNMTVNSSLFFKYDPCPRKPKQLYMEYVCVDSLNTPKGKLCEEPLLQNITMFPDEIFSASDLNGYEARLSNKGWCPQNSGTQYLQIDLQRDYFISHIAIFGDKERTKYDLQYSRTLRDLGSSVKKTVNANPNAHCTSITELYIKYARFLRITVNQGNAVCIRVQLCGHVLLPDPVRNIIVNPKTARTANISWTLPANEGHSDVTYFLIAINDSNPTIHVTRKADNNQHTFGNLKPYTNYKVIIQAGNTYGLSESSFKTFMTDEAAASEVPTSPSKSSNIILYVVIVGLVVIVAVLVIVVVYLTVCRRKKSRPSTTNENVDNIENVANIGDINAVRGDKYDDVIPVMDQDLEMNDRSSDQYDELQHVGEDPYEDPYELPCEYVQVVS